MSYCEYYLSTHPRGLRILVGGGCQEETIKKALRRASHNRRTLVRERPQNWAHYLIRELFKVSKLVIIDTVPLGSQKKGWEVCLGEHHNKLTLRIRDKATDEILYNGSFFSFLGRSTPVYEEEAKKGPRLTRHERLWKLKEEYFKRHGYYPEDATPDSPKRYSRVQRKLNKQYVANQVKATKIKESAQSSRKRKALVRKLGVRFGKFKIKDHYETPPKEIK